MTRIKHKAKTNRVRLQVAQEAAKIIATEGVHDFLRAKKKAADRLNVLERRNMPTNQEIDECLQAYQSLFQADTKASALRTLRQVALDAMTFFSGYEPVLSGAVLHGTATIHSEVELHLFCDEFEQLILFLQENDIPFDQGERKLRIGDDLWQEYPLLTFKAGESNVSLVVFQPRDRARPPLSKIDGKPVRRAGRQQVQALLAGEL